MDTYTISQVIFTLIIWIIGIALIIKARKLQKAKKSKAKIIVCYVIGILILLSMLGQLLSYVGASPQDTAESTQATQKTTSAPTPPTRAQLLKLVNQVRAKNGVAPLKEDATLDKSAQWKADDEVTYNYFGHDKPGTTGVGNGLKYLESIGSPCGDGNISENLTENTHQNTAQAAVNAWVNSKPHFAAMIDARYTLTGFGIDKNEIVEHFCSPERFTTSTTVPDTE